MPIRPETTLSLSAREGRYELPETASAPIVWSEPESVLTVGSHRIGGMVYTSERSPGWHGEPSAIHAKAEVARMAADSSEPLGYWANYSDLTPDQRTCYLEWLSSGRCDKDPSVRDLGYIFMFFYGIERRVLVDKDSDPRLLEEVARILAHYGPGRKSRSFVSYFSEFLHFAAFRAGAKAYRSQWPSFLPLHDDHFSETALTLILSNLHSLNENMDWTIAYRVAMHHDRSRRSVVVRRTGRRFFEMFRQRFEEAYPDGLPLEAGKRERVVRYRAANRTITGSYVLGCGLDMDLELRVPNVFGLKGQFSKLPKIWNACIEELSGYSRALGRATKDDEVTAREALKVFLALPDNLRNPAEHPLREQIDAILADCPPENGLHFVPVRLFQNLLALPDRETLTASQSRQVAELIQTSGRTFAPHPHHLKLPLRSTQEIAVFDGSDADSESELLPGLLRLLYLSILVAAADGTVDDQELGVFRTACADLPLTESDRCHLDATEAALLRDTNIALKNLNRIAKSTIPERRPTVVHLLAMIAGADDVITSDEHRILKRIVRAMELPDESIDEIVANDPGFRTVTVVPKGRRSRKGEAIPPRPKAAEPFSIDMALVDAISAETREVVTILGKVLADDDVETEAVMISAAPTAPGSDSTPTDADMDQSWLEELEPRFRGALLELIALGEPAPDDFDRIAASHHLMKTDLVDSVNAWSDEALGDFLLEHRDDGSLTIYDELIPAKPGPTNS